VICAAFTSGTAVADADVVDATDLYQLQVLAEGGVIPHLLVMLMSLCHWISQPICVGWRFWASVLSPFLFSVAFIYAVLSSPGSGRASDAAFIVFDVLLLLGVAGMVVSTFPFRGRWWLPAAHTVTVLVGLWFWFIGSMALAHDWI
jgi:hypothetical protein